MSRRYVSKCWSTSAEAQSACDEALHRGKDGGARAPCPGRGRDQAAHPPPFPPPRTRGPNSTAKQQRDPGREEANWIYSRIYSHPSVGRKASGISRKIAKTGDSAMLRNSILRNYISIYLK